MDETNFATGTQYLQYYYAGNAAYTKTREIVKTPAYPSAGEDHGHRFWGGVENFDSQLNARLDDNYWIGQWDNDSHTEADYTNGGREGKFPAGQDALVALGGELELGTLKTHASDTKPFIYFAKLGLLASSMGLDPVSAECSSISTPIPTREMFLRGYNDVEEYTREAVAYDIVAGMFRADQGFTNGLTVIEDFIIRESAAKYIHYTTLNLAGMTAGVGSFAIMDTGGMWETAHKVGGMTWAAMMPGYSSELYGTAGFEGFTQTTYTDAPFDTDEYTWYEMFYTDPIGTITGYPELHRHFGFGDSDEYNFTNAGHWAAGSGYTTVNNMGYPISIYGNLLQLFAPTRNRANMDAAMVKGAAGTLNSIPEPENSPLEALWAPLQNSWHPSFREDAGAAMDLLSSPDPNSQAKMLQNTDVFGVIWFDSDYSGSASIIRSQSAASALLIA